MLLYIFKQVIKTLFPLLTPIFAVGNYMCHCLYLREKPTNQTKAKQKLCLTICFLISNVTVTALKHFEAFMMSTSQKQNVLMNSHQI